MTDATTKPYAPRRRIHLEAHDLTLPCREKWGRAICSPYPAKRARGVCSNPKTGWKFTDDAGKVTCKACHRKMLAEHDGRKS